jgi:hypothetical protein
MNKHGLCNKILTSKHPKSVQIEKLSKEDSKLIKIGLTEFNAHYRMDRLQKLNKSVVKLEPLLLI